MNSHHLVFGPRGSEHDGLFVLMELVSGKSLDDLLKTLGPFSEAMTSRITQQTLEALAFCHERHVIHRDIKAKNILMTPEGVVKVCDFGSAKVVENLLMKDAPSNGYFCLCHHTSHSYLTQFSQIHLSTSPQKRSKVGTALVSMSGRWVALWFRCCLARSHGLKRAGPLLSRRFITSATALRSLGFHFVVQLLVTSFFNL